MSEEVIENLESQLKDKDKVIAALQKQSADFQLEILAVTAMYNDATGKEKELRKQLASTRLQLQSSENQNSAQRAEIENLKAAQESEKEAKH